MDDFFNFLDNPGRAVGLNPQDMSPEDRNAYRGQAMASVFGAAAGGPSPYEAMASIGDRLDARQIRKMQMALEMQKVQMGQMQMQDMQGIGDLFRQGGGDPGAPGGGMPPGGPAAGPGGPAMGAPGGMVPEGAPGAPGAPGAAAQPANPNAARAELYRKAALRMARYPEQAQKYIEIADKLDPVEKWSSDPRPMMGPDGKVGMYLISDKGNHKLVSEGMGQAPKFGRPFATDKGMAVVNENDGSVKDLGVQDQGPAAVQEYRAAQAQGFKGTLLQFQERLAQAGRSNIVLNTGNTLGQDMAKQIAQQVMASKTTAEGASASLDAIAQVEQGLKDGAIVGPGADMRVGWARLVQQFGGDTETGKKLAATALTLQGLSKASLEQATQMAGQGSITENERRLIADASGGKKDMTVPELQALSGALRKVNERKIANYQRDVKSIQNNPDLKPLHPFLESHFPNGQTAAAGTNPPMKAGEIASQQKPIMVQPGVKVPKGVLTTQAISILRAHPETAATFDQYYGQGMAAKYLGGK